MASTHWTKWYWSDWANDPALRLCSLSAQGLWMRMLCIAAEANPIGYVTVNGRTLDGQDLARIVGVSVPEVETLLAELDRNGVFSRDRKGTCYSRRMVRDAKRAKIARQNGKNGGNPTLRKQTAIPASDNPPLKTHKPEARIPDTRKEEDGVLTHPKRARKAPSLPLPDDWAPDETDFEYGRNLGLTHRQITDRAEDLRLWARSKDERKADWRATFRGFLRRTDKQTATGPPLRSQAKPMNGWEAILRNATKPTPPDEPDYDLDLTPTHVAGGRA